MSLAKPASYLRRCVEVFSGSGHWSKAMARVGWETHEWDILHGDKHDLLNRANQRRLFSLVVQCDWVHVALPCCTYSTALRGQTVLRTREYPYGRPGLSSQQQDRVESHNRLLEFTLRLIRFCRRRNIGLSLENPSGSKLWGMPCLRKEARHATRNVVDYCCFATAWRKRTCFTVWNSDALKSLNAYRCTLSNGCCQNSGRPHQLLDGRAPGGKPWTLVAQAYPMSLCRVIATALDDAFDRKRLFGFWALVK